MKQSAITSKNHKKYLICSILSFVITFLPIFVYVIKGFCNSTVVIEKVVLTCTIMVSIILTAINVIFKYHIRSTLWILLLGIYVCLDNVLTMIILIAIASIIDEFLLTPLKNSYKNKYKINKEIDQRIE